MFTQFIAENDFPCVKKIDVSGKDWWKDWWIENELTEASVIPFIQTLLEKGIPNLQVVDLSCIITDDVITVDNHLDDHFAQSLINLFASAKVDCRIKSILFDGMNIWIVLLIGNPFSPEVSQQMKCIYGGGQ